jgi:hypothetical protein
VPPAAAAAAAAAAGQPTVSLMSSYVAHSPRMP